MFLKLSIKIKLQSIILVKLIKVKEDINFNVMYSVDHLISAKLLKIYLYNWRFVLLTDTRTECVVKCIK